MAVSGKKESFWAALFWGSFVFCGLEAISMAVAYLLFSTAPNNTHTPVIAIGFGFMFGFCGLGAMTAILFDRIALRLEVPKGGETTLFQKVVKEAPFFFFSLLYFFAMAFFLGVFLLMIPYIHHAGAIK